MSGDLTPWEDGYAAGFSRGYAEGLKAAKPVEFYDHTGPNTEGVHHYDERCCTGGCWHEYYLVDPDRHLFSPVKP